MPIPTRMPNGFTTDEKYQPLAAYGFRNPFFWHEWEDDFDSVNAAYTQTKTGNGTIAATAGNGGLALFTTNSSSPAGTDICSVQLPVASFKYTAGKKIVFLCRIQTNDATNLAFNLGLIQTTATPFTVTDGIYFNKATGSLTALTQKVAVSSAITTQAIPSGTFTLANNTNIDLGFLVTPSGEVVSFVGAQLVGFLPQSGTGAVNASGYTVNPQMGPAARMSGVTLPSANLNFTLAVQSGNAASHTATIDFAMAAVER